MNFYAKNAVVWVISGPEMELVYKIPQDLCDILEIGHLVRVPLGKRICLGIVVSFESEKEYEFKLKNISEIVYDKPILTPDLIKLAIWMIKYYGISKSSILETMIPSEIRNEKSFQFYCTINLTNEWKNFTSKEDSECQNFHEKIVKILGKRSQKQIEICNFIFEKGGSCLRSEIYKTLKANYSHLCKLAKLGLIKEIWARNERENTYIDSLDSAEIVNSQDLKLTDEQMIAVEDICKSLGSYKTHLLHGVTGSGKTEIYLRVIKSVLNRNGSALFLVPEIALTAQTVGRLHARLKSIGIKSVVWHSSLSKGERFDSWMSIVNGDSRVVVGARSAIFAPLKNLQLVIVDEEHEPSYKQSDNPRYSARDVSVYRSVLEKSVCILGSATPSLESFYNAQNGKYLLNTLNKRVDNRLLPLVHIVDMKLEKKQGMFSGMLMEKLADRLEKREQTILFVNRRGYASSMICPDCGYVSFCPNCSVSLTWHSPKTKEPSHVSNKLAIQTSGLGSQTGGLGSQTGGLGSQTGGLGSQTSGLGSQTGGLGSQTGGLGNSCQNDNSSYLQSDRLCCHLCGYSTVAWDRCPGCSSDSFRWRRFGTQKAEHLLHKLFPMARIARIDGDVLEKDRMRNILADFRLGKLDILLGTQMIAKGLDFPNVTLVGLLEADLSLHMPDFRANERTFQLIVQVAGRAGRGDRSGEVIIQTWIPHATPIQFARQSNFTGFLEDELRQRKLFSYPPFRHILRLIFKSKNKEQLELFTNNWLEKIETEIHSVDSQIEIRGPAPAPIEKIQCFFRFHLWLLTNQVTKLTQFILNFNQKFPPPQEIQIILDVDPVDLM